MSRNENPAVPGTVRSLRVEWRTVALIVGCYGLWMAAGTIGWSLSPWLAMLVLTLAVALHSSLMHEAAHGHPTRNGLVNEALVGLPIGVVYPYRRFRKLHLSHHADERLTDPFDDPESWYQALWRYQALPAGLRSLLVFNNTMIGRFLIGPAISNVAFLLSDWKLLRAGDPAVQRAWRHHLVGLAILLPILVFAFRMPLWLHLVPVYLGQSIIAIRTFAEHQWSERPDGRTIIVERSPLALLFLNNNLHLVHHKQPNVPWYELPRLFRARREEWMRMNAGYVFPSYFALFRAFALTQKEAVVHPVLRRTPEPGRAFRPRVRQRSVHGLGSAPVPAEPSRK
ncbi:fatty acid desaturase [Aliihoeflea aestuarii]|uniref:fatty acid desaturase n=1 Tax=Aliihoeflea aestuarii TaxID=453840 RepID=UPI002092D417|nr:fatty acid desaturase [Aliihoeflea aestuarii]MCO6391970.1 fatty acid desaturase [Aliihoeflea aestuarii]